MVKSIGCSSRGPEFNSQHPHGGSQPSVTPVLGDLMPSFDTYVVMNWLYHMFESINSILFLAFAPFMYCVGLMILQERKKD